VGGNILIINISDEMEHGTPFVGMIFFEKASKNKCKKGSF